MTIEKAIENLKVGRKDAGMIPAKEYTPTIDLAIQVLEWARSRNDALTMLLREETTRIRKKNSRGKSLNARTALLQGERRVL